MNSKPDMMLYTVAEDAREVRVGEFRGQMSHLERLVACDYHSCVGQEELAHWAARARNVGSELIHLTCKRATVADWNRRELVIERSTRLLAKIEEAAEQAAAQE